MEGERIKELFLGLILIVFLILLSVVVISISDNSYSQKQGNVISNSYNVNSYNSLSKPNPQYGNKVYNKNVKYVKPSKSYSTSKHLSFPKKHSRASRTHKVISYSKKPSTRHYNNYNYYDRYRKNNFRYSHGSPTITYFFSK